jgi:hypothetical protein
MHGSAHGWLFQLLPSSWAYENRPANIYQGKAVFKFLEVFSGVGVHARREGGCITDFAAGPEDPSNLTGLRVQLRNQ